MNTQDHLKRLKSITHGDCDICGCHSTMLVHGVCQKACCCRRVEEGRVDISMQIAETEKLAEDYTGQGYE